MPGRHRRRWPGGGSGRSSRATCSLAPPPRSWPGTPVPLRPHGQPAEDRRGRPRLEDRVADNAAKQDITESESLLIRRDFGVGTESRPAERKPVGRLPDEGSDLRGLPSVAEAQSRGADAPPSGASVPALPRPGRGRESPAIGPLRDAHAGHLAQRHRKRRCTMHMDCTTASLTAATRARAVDVSVRRGCC